MPTIDLTPEEANNLAVFLARVQLTGQEATVFVLLLQKLAQAQQQAVPAPGASANGTDSAPANVTYEPTGMVEA